MVRAPRVIVQGKPKGPSVARAFPARNPILGSSGAETGARKAQKAAGPKPRKPATAETKLRTEQIPIIESEVGLMLHWAGDILADLMKSDTDGP